MPGPKLVKGALVILRDGQNANIIAFQYNPETLTRSFTPHYIGGKNGNQAERVRFQGAPTETISVDVMIDSIDQMADGKSKNSDGIHPQLAALELLGSPTMDEIRKSVTTLDNGSIEIQPSEVPLTVFVYGPNRVAPVTVDSVTVTEELHDPSLNPIRAKVSMKLSVISYSTTPKGTKGFETYMNYQARKEKMAGTVGVRSSSGTVRASVSDYLSNKR